MKKTFRSILAGALALLAVSCYDDSGLRDDIKKLDERVTALETTLNAEVASVNDLASKLTAAQTAITNLQESVGTLDTDLAALKSTVNSILTRLDAVDGETDGKIANLEAAIAALEAADDEFDTELAEAIAKIAVTKVEEKDGNVVLTLATGGEVVLSKPMSNVDNNGLVTIVEDEEGIRHWAVVLADGTTEMLPFVVGAAGTIEFKVEDNELLYTLNGEDWATTGAYVSENSYSLLTYFGQKEEFDEDLWDWVTDDFYTLEFGGVEYQLPLYKVDESVVVIKSGKTYFKFGEEKTIDVVLKDIKQADLMSKPDGWRAQFNGKKLTLTAPAEANVLSGVSEADGEILFHCITNDGGCKVAKLMVATTKGFSLTLADDGTLTIVNPFVVTTNHMIWGEQTDFRDAYIGLATVADFEAGHEAYLESVVYEETDDKNTYISNWKSNTTEYDDVTETVIYKVGGAYKPGVYEEDIITTTVAEMYADWTYGQELPSSPYVVWACPVDEKGKPQIEELVFAYYTPSVKATVEAVSLTTSDVEMKISVQGTERYYVNVIPEQYTYGLPIDTFMTMEGEGPFAQFQSMVEMGGMYLQWAFQPMGMPFGGEDGYNMPETIKASKIMGGSLMPNSKIYVCVFPVVEGVDLADYTYEKNLKPYIYEFTTNGLQSGGTATVSFEEMESNFTRIDVKIIPDDKAKSVFYKFYNSDTIGDMSAEDVVKTGTPAEFGDTEVVAKELNLQPGTALTLAAVAVDADSMYGEIISETFKSKSIEVSKTFKVELGEEAFVLSTVGGGYNYNFPVTVTGGEVKTYHYSFLTYEYDEEIYNVQNLPLAFDANFYYVETSANLDGIYANADTKYYLYVVAESTTGEFAQVVKKEVTVLA